MKTTAKTTDSRPSQPSCKRRAKPVQKSRRESLLTREETTNLVMQAQEAFHYQSTLGNIEPGNTFDQWRRDQVMDSVGKAGISNISRPDWKTVKAHFLTLSGREDEALALLTHTGTKSYRPVSGSDTWETCEEYAALVTANLNAHRAAAVTHPKGHIHEGWFLSAARQRTGKPTLTMATLAERLDPSTLHGMLAHLRNHIALREGRATQARGKRTYPKEPDPGQMHEDPDAPF
jgi:hypothetical protein